MSSSTIEKIKERLDIVEVIGGYVKLQKAGHNYKGISPFTNERTPSFFVSQERQLYHCFSTGKGGDIFTFIQELEGVDFRGALKMLAERAGVELVREDPKQASAKERIYKLIDDATLFYSRQLSEKSTALQYLKKRGVTDATIKSFRLGYAKDDWRLLLDYAKNKGYTDSELRKAGLIKETDKNTSNRFYDTFRGRVLFPLADSSGRIIAFSGRSLDADRNPPKYLNSPDTELFNKSEALYGFDKAKTAIRKRNYSILVEGQVDLILMHQIGFTNTVSTSGTAATDRHLEKLKKISPNIIFCFDSDRAGQEATMRTAHIALGLGMEVKAAPLSEGSDPADLILSDKEKMKGILKNAQHIVEFFTKKSIETTTSHQASIRTIRDRVVPFIAKIESPIERDRLCAVVADMSTVNKKAIEEEVELLRKKPDGTETPARHTRFSTKKLEQRSPERELVSLLLWQESQHNPSVDIAGLLTKIEDIIGKDGLSALRERAENKKDQLIFEIEELYAGTPPEQKFVSELLLALEDNVLRKKVLSVQKDIKIAEKVGSDKVIDTAVQEWHNLVKRRAEITKKRKKLHGET